MRKPGKLNVPRVVLGALLHKEHGNPVPSGQTADTAFTHTHNLICRHEFRFLLGGGGPCIHDGQTSQG